MSERHAAPVSILWIGPCDDELLIAREAAGRMTDVHDAASVPAAVSSPPAVFADRSPGAVVLASPTPFSWTTAECACLARRWPLAPLVSVASSLVEGRRRSGPALPGVEEVAWNEFAGRLAWWLHDRRRGVPGGIGQPATARREERILEASVRVAEQAATATWSVSVAASQSVDLEGVVDAVAVIGGSIRSRSRGRPPLEDPADVIVWDVASPTTADLTWLAMLTAHRPSRAVVLLESFPRAGTVRAALDAGAAAVLGRPLSVESLSGVLLGMEPPPVAVCD